MNRAVRSPRFLVIVNPRAGRGRAMQAAWRLEALLRQEAIPFTIARTRHAGEASDVARHAAPDVEAVVAVGGDGTMHEVACGLADAAEAAGDPARVAALAVVPFGTGNDFVKTFGIGPRVEDGFAALVSGRRRRIDLGRAGPIRARGERLHREWFANDLSAGFGAQVVRDMIEPPFYLRALTGQVAYVAAGLRRLFFRPRPMIVRVDGREHRQDFYEVHVGNGRFCGGGIQYTPRAVPDDGLLDVSLFHTMPRWSFLATNLGPVRHGTLVPAPERGIEMLVGHAVEIEQSQEFPIYLDGESRMVEGAEGRPASVRVEVVPGALEVLVPATVDSGH